MGKTLKRNALYLCVTLGLVALLAWGALQATPPLPKLFYNQDKLEHLLAFSALTLWLTAMFRPSRMKLAAMIAFAGAVTLELAQAMLTTTRLGSLADLIASSVGIWLATAFVVLMRQVMRRPPSTPSAEVA